MIIRSENIHAPMTLGPMLKQQSRMQKIGQWRDKMTEEYQVEDTDDEFSPEYLAREKRVNDAISLTKPDRIPIVSVGGNFLLNYGGLSIGEAMYNYEKAAKIVKESMIKINWDMAPNPVNAAFPGPVLELLGVKAIKWPGYNLKENLSHQFVEGEYMLADEYDEFLKNPGDFTIRKFLPRISETFAPMSSLPAIHVFGNIYYLFKAGATMMGMPPLKKYGVKKSSGFAVFRMFTLNCFTMLSWSMMILEKNIWKRHESLQGSFKSSIRISRGQSISISEQ